MKAIQKGFTLIELMIVVAIVGILAAIALPAYQDYIARAKMTEPLAKLDELKLSIAEYVASNNATPDNSASAGVGSGTGLLPVNNMQYYDAVGYQEVADNQVVRIGVRLNGNANSTLANRWLIMTGTVQSADGTVSWACGSDVPASSSKYLPANCRSTSSITPN